ncbi:MAG: helix-turn-helix domain-containing protein [Phycisphaerales bacterium]
MAGPVGLGKPLRVYSTGRIARICGVAARTVSKWIDSGALPGYRIPGSMDRRVSYRNLVRFLERNHMEDALAALTQTGRILVIGAATEFAMSLRSRLAEDETITVDTASSGIEAGFTTARLLPNYLVIDAAIGRIETVQLIQCVVASEKQGRLTVLVVGCADGSWFDACPDVDVRDFLDRDPEKVAAFIQRHHEETA